MAKTSGKGSAKNNPNSNRANTLNPNNPAHRATSNNRSNQMNPNNPAYHSSRSGNK